MKSSHKVSEHDALRSMKHASLKQPFFFKKANVRGVYIVHNYVTINTAC